MSQGSHELGAQAAFLASCVSRCPISFSSPEKKFRIFNSDTKYSVIIKDGMGYFTVLNKNTEDISTNVHFTSNSDMIPSEEFNYDDFFEVENGESTSCDHPELADQGIIIYNHLISTISQLYSTKVVHLHLAFSIALSKSSTTDKNPSDNMITLTDVFSCIIEENDYFPLFKMVPDGCDLISQIVILFGRYRFKENQCLCFNEMEQICPKASLSSTLKYKLSELFFDCKKIDELYIYVKRIIEDVNEENMLQPIVLCQNCYNSYMLFESKRIKTAQLLAKYSRDFYNNREEEKRLKKINALRKSEIRRVKKKSAHGCGSNLSFQERRVMLDTNNSFLIAGKQSIKPTKLTFASINNFSRTSPLNFRKTENNNQSNVNDRFPSIVVKPKFSSTVPMPKKMMNI